MDGTMRKIILMLGLLVPIAYASNSPFGFHEKIPMLHGHWKGVAYLGDIHDQKHRLGTVFEGDNVIVTSGKNLLLDRLFANAGFGGAIADIGVGNSSTGAGTGDTQLLGASVLLQGLDSPATRSGLVETLVSTFATGSANFTWNEMGSFNGTSNGTSIMLNRIAPIGPFTKTSSVSIVVTLTITQG